MVKPVFINITPIPAFKDNYIWMLSDSSSAWVVDPGDAGPVIKTLTENNLFLSGILITHHHNDHTGGIAALLEYAGNIPVYGHHHSTIPNITEFVKEGDEINVLTMKLYVLEIPGHTLDHIAFYNEKILFCGDTLFSGGCGRLFEGTPQQMLTSLEKISSLSDTVKIYCGHEYTLSNLEFARHIDPSNKLINIKIVKTNKKLMHSGCSLPSTLADEQMTNPFLRCHKPEIVKSVEKSINMKLDNTLEVFRHLRELKNNFKSSL